MTASLAFRDLCNLGRPRDAVLEAMEHALSSDAVCARLRVHDRNRTYPEDVIDELRALGLPSLFTDAGDEARTSRTTAYHLTWLNALAARGSGSLAITLGVNALALLPLYLAGSEAQRARVFDWVRRGASASLLLTERSHGSDLSANEAHAEQGRLDARGAFSPSGDGTHFRLSGEKHLINGGARHRILSCLMRTRARTPDESGERLSAGADFTLFVVERGPRIRASERHRTLPCPGADISDVHFDEQIVGAESVVGGVGEGLALVQRTLAISRGGISGLAAGTVSAARQCATEHAHERRLYGRPIIELGAIADHLVRLHALDVVVAALSLKQAAFVNAFGPGAAYVTAVAKYASTRFAEEAVDEGRRVLGARALVEDGPYYGLVRDVVLYGVFDGTMHVMLEEIQWRLAQLAAQRGQASPDTLDELGAIYRTEPRSLVQAGRVRGRVRVMPIAAHLTSLARHAPRLAAASTVAEGLLQVVADLRAGGVWESDQGIRFAAASALCELEAMAAVAELGDGSCRAALGMGRAPCAPELAERYEHAVGYAIGWLGSRAASAVRSLARRAGRIGEALDHAESDLAAAADAAAISLRAAIRAAQGPEERR